MTCRRRGFALPVALWVVVAMGAVAAGSLHAARLVHTAIENRIVLARAGWARDGCVELLLLRYRSEVPAAGMDSVDLGRTAWCRAAVTDPSTRINVNLASRSVLSRLLGSDSLAQALIDWRDPDDEPGPGGAEREWYRAAGRRGPRNAPLQDLAELRGIRGFEGLDEGRLSELLTLEGDGAVNLADASVQVLAAAMDVEGAALASMEQARREGWRAESVADLIARMPASAQPQLEGRLPELEAGMVVRPSRLVVLAEGRVGSSPLRAWARIVAVPLPERLAVVRRTIW